MATQGPTERQTNMSAPQDYGDLYLQWTFPEFEKHERTRRWYIISILVVIGVFLFAYIDKNPLLAVIVILGIIIFIVTEVRGPDFHNIVIAEDGIVTGPIFTPYTKLKNFYIVYDPPRIKMLYFAPASIFATIVRIPIEDQDPTLIREVLLNHLPEDTEKENEPAADLWGKLLKF